MKVSHFELQLVQCSWIFRDTTNFTVSQDIGVVLQTKSRSFWFGKYVLTVKVHASSYCSTLLSGRGTCHGTSPSSLRILDLHCHTSTRFTLHFCGTSFHIQPSNYYICRRHGQCWNCHPLPLHQCSQTPLPALPQPDLAELLEPSTTPSCHIL